MKGEGGHSPPPFGTQIPPYKPNQQDQYGGGIQNNLTIQEYLFSLSYVLTVSIVENIRIWILKI